MENVCAATLSNAFAKLLQRLYVHKMTVIFIVITSQRSHKGLEGPFP
jgi:hypothetical protein